MTPPNRAVRSAISTAMQDNDRFVLEFDYTRGDGAKTHRVVSPVRWTRDKSGFVALCLGREGCRTFTVKRCRNVRLSPASDHVMPVSIEELD